MNTREREEVLKVMDALANALRSARDSVCSELTHERAAFKGYEGSSNIASLEAELVAIDSAVAAYDCLTTDEHDALLAEGSASSAGAERRPIADEVVEPPYFVEVDKNGCSACGHERSWTVVGPGDIAEGQSWLDEEEAARLCERMNAAYYAGRESALPRGLPAGSDALIRREIHSLREYATVSDDSAYGTLATSFVREHCDRIEAALATTEQPSCGQDARDAARYRWLRMANDRDDDGAPCIQVAESYPDFTNYPAGDKFDEAVDSFMHIAAQQRQGGEE